MKYNYNPIFVKSGKQILMNYRKGKIACSFFKDDYSRLIKELEKEVTGEDIDQSCYAYFIMSNNEVKAFSILHSLMNTKFPIAYYYYGQLIKYGKTFSKDPDEVVSCFNKTIEIIPNFAPSIYELGLCYLEGYGVKKDISKGLELITKASNLGDTNATYFLHKVYINEQYGCKINHKKSYKLLKKIYKYHNEARFELAYKQLYGLGCSNNYRKAFKNFDYLVKNYNNLDAAINCGIILANDRFKMKNINKASDYLLIGANAGIPIAMFKLSEIYILNYYDNIPLREQGIEWLKKAARLGYEDAQRVAKEINIKY